MSEEAQEATFVVQRIYVKDMSFEAPKSPEVFSKRGETSVALELNVSNVSLGDDNFEVTLGLTVTNVNQSEEVVYLVEIQQSGIFVIRGVTKEVLAQTLGSFCPNVLFPYARAAIDSIVTTGSFPALMLAPINFDAMYSQARAKSEAETASFQ
jgi:preprotein translocase subunit SecB